MKQLKITTSASAVITLDGFDVDDVIREAADLAHEVLEVYKNILKLKIKQG